MNTHIYNHYSSLTHTHTHTHHCHILHYITPVGILHSVCVSQRLYEDKLHVQQRDAPSCFACLSLHVCVSSLSLAVTLSPSMHCSTALLHTHTKTHTYASMHRYKYEHLHINDILRLTHTHTSSRWPLARSAVLLCHFKAL